MIAVFFVPVGLLYGFWTRLDRDRSGRRLGLFLAAALCGSDRLLPLVTGRRLDNRPRTTPALISTSIQGDYGFFSPYCWWPLWLGLTAAICFLGLAVGWWLFIIGAFFGIVGARRLDLRVLQGRARQLTRIPAGRLTAEPGSPRSIGAKRRTSWGDQSQPSSWSRSSLIPKWWATSCTTVTAISSQQLLAVLAHPGQRAPEDGDPVGQRAGVPPPSRSVSGVPS